MKHTTASVLALFLALALACGGGGESNQGSSGGDVDVSRDSSSADGADKDLDDAQAADAEDDAQGPDTFDVASDDADDADDAVDVQTAAPVLCRPCEASADCAGVDGARCVDFGAAGAFCGIPCVGDEDCPTGYGCGDLSAVEEEPVTQCFPMDGVCDCRPEFVDGGFTTACVNANDFGTCEGHRVCMADGLSDCDAPIPEPEDCDGLDDDCDGDTDEDLLGEQTSCGQGACAATGGMACVDGAWIDTCAPGEPGAEACDGIDDDCDGETDEELGVGAACPELLGVCLDAPARCADGVWACDGPAFAAHAEAWEADEATCDGLDNDCDGDTDEGMEAIETSCGVGACAATGTGTCVDGALVDDCVPGEPADDDASCDGADDDCDGQIDEDYAAPVTSCGQGACAAEGVLLCEAGVTLDSCTPTAPGAEACNAVDDDCDGMTDEDELDEGALPCDLGAGFGSGVCKDGQCVEPCVGEDDWPDDAFEDTNCDGVDGDVEEAIFVAPAQWGGDDFNPGTPDLPKLTIQAAIDAAAADPDRRMVLISAGTYDGPLTLAPGVHVYGGYHKPMDWARSVEYEALVTVADAYQEGTHQVGVIAHGIPVDQAATLERVSVQVADNGQDGGSNYGIHALDAPGLALRHLVLTVGQAGAGVGMGEAAAAGTGGSTGVKGASGDEQDYDDGCGYTSPPDPAPATAAPACAGAPAGDGGAGGQGGHQSSKYGQDGSAGEAAGAAAGGAGGENGSYQGYSGSNGQPGANGLPGVDGSAGAAFGGFTTEGWYAPAVGDVTTLSTHGAAGGGGGGGGGGAYGYDQKGIIFKYDCFERGGAGGAGGAGGCGGVAGTPGAGGGAAFGALFVNCSPIVAHSSVTVAQGGTGGVGQPGGAGGGGGWGGGKGWGSGDNPDAGDGGEGGHGGVGGRGGHGGGGGGGPSFCFGYFGPDVVPDTGSVSDTTCDGTVGGAGGPSEGNVGLSGEAGTVKACTAECLL
jgi:hypothetical protein